MYQKHYRLKIVNLITHTKKKLQDCCPGSEKLNDLEATVLYALAQLFVGRKLHIFNHVQNFSFQVIHPYFSRSGTTDLHLTK